jgi:hypothetical protein
MKYLYNVLFSDCKNCKFVCFFECRPCLLVGTSVGVHKDPNKCRLRIV